MTFALKQLGGQLQHSSAQIPNHAVSVSEDHVSCGLWRFYALLRGEGVNNFWHVKQFWNNHMCIICPEGLNVE